MLPEELGVLPKDHHVDLVIAVKAPFSVLMRARGEQPSAAIDSRLNGLIKLFLYNSK